MIRVALRHGLDRTKIGYYVGRALVFGIPLYVITVELIGLIG